MMNYFRSIDGKSLGKRLVFVAISMFLMYSGVACYYCAHLGTDPYSVMIDGEHYFLNLSYGMVTNINNAVLFVFMLIYGRRYINIGTVINMGLGGTVLDLFNNFIVTYIPATTFVPQFIMLLYGVVAFAAGLGFYITAGVGIGGTDFISLEISERFGIKLDICRIGFDVVTMLIGIVLGLLAGKGLFDMIGIGTVLGAFGTGVVMVWTMKVLEPANKWFGPLKK